MCPSPNQSPSPEVQVQVQVQFRVGLQVQVQTKVQFRVGLQVQVQTKVRQKIGLQVQVQLKVRLRVKSKSKQLDFKVQVQADWTSCASLVGGQLSDVVMEFPSERLRKDDIQEAPPSNQIESAGGLLRLEVHVSRHRKRFVPLADTTGRNLGLISPPNAIPNFGAGHEIIQTHLRFRAMLTCRFARRPPCRSHVPGGALIEYPPPPHTELLAFDGTEGAKLVLSEETSQNFVRGKCVPVWCYSPRSKSRNLTGNNPPSSTSSALRRWCCFSLSAHLDHVASPGGN